MRAGLGRRWILILIAAVACITLPAWAPTFTVQLTVRGMYLGVLAMTFILLAGYADMISLTQMSFAAMAGYVIAIGTVKLGLSHGVLVPLAILGSVALGAVFGLVAIRGRKVYFLMMTLALGQLFYGVGMQWVSLTGGGYGFTGLTRPSPFGVPLDGAVPLYFLTLIVTVLSYMALRRVVSSNFGLVLQGIRDNPRRMTALGFDVQLHRYAVIVISAAFAGVAGILTTYYTGVVSPSRAGLSQSVMVVMAALVGGAKRLEGGLLGGVLIAFLLSITNEFTTRYWTVIGLLFVLVVLFMPNGLLGQDLHPLRRLRAHAARSAAGTDGEREATVGGGEKTTRNTGGRS